MGEECTRIRLRDHQLTSGIDLSDSATAALEFEQGCCSRNGRGQQRGRDEHAKNKEDEFAAHGHLPRCPPSTATAALGVILVAACQGVALLRALIYRRAIHDSERE